MTLLWLVQQADHEIQIKKGTKDGRKWTNDDEAQFVSLLEAELDKVHTFQKVCLMTTCNDDRSNRVKQVAEYDLWKGRLTKLLRN